MSKILFILKRREDYNAILHNNIGLSTGLYNSASFMNDMLVDMGYESYLQVAIDNNCIDRLVTRYRPTHVIIEALWVVPSKFDILQKLHPNVKWIIRLHSEMPFMAGEGMAMDWIKEYSRFKNITIACNAPRMLREIEWFVGKKNVIYLPNFYPQEYKHKTFNKDKDVIDVSCFGAIRPLKNHLVQAFAAIQFAEEIGKKLRFHINAGRIEMKGDAVKNNIRGLFEQISDTGHQLINHQWIPREQFLELCSQMDIGLQCSFSETFNIVGADLISQGVPLVGSKEIPWSANFGNADPTDSQEILDALHRTYHFPQINVKLNQFNLKRYTNNTRKIWNKYFL
jgi:hypothetical protein